jgi:PAS domain S-box-containing protein
MELSEKRMNTVSAGSQNDTDNRPALAFPKNIIISLYAIGFLILAALVVLFIWHELGTAYRDTLAYWNVQLSSSADEQAAVSALWLKERRTDTTAIAENPSTIRLLAAVGDKNKVAALRQQVEGEIAHMAAVNGFLGGAVGDGDCQITVQTGLRPEMAQGVQEACQRVQQSGEYEIDAFGMEKGHVWLNLSAPVWAEGPASPSAPFPRRIVGSVVMVMDLWQDFILIFGGESVPTKTSETLLVWKELREALIYSPRRSARGVPSFFRRPLAMSTFESIVAREGDVAFGEFIDYRGVRVFGAARHINPDGDSVASKVDWDEALASYHRQRDLDWLAGTLSLLLLGSVMVTLRRHVATRDLEERFRQQEALRERDRRYRVLFESAGDGIFLMQGDHFVDCNQKALELFGCEREQLIGNTPYALSPLQQPNGSNSQEAALEKIRVALEGQTLHFEWRHLRLDGTPFEAEVTLSRLDIRGEAHLLAMVRDVTEQKRAEEALRESQALTNAIVNSTSDMIWTVDPERFGLLTFNHSLRDFFLQQRGIRLQTNMRDADFFLDQSNLDHWHALYQRALSEGSYTTEYTVTVGTHVLQLTFNLLKRDGKLFGISIFGKDITERKRAEEALRESEERFRATFENAGSGMALVDLQGHPIKTNPALRQMLGYSEEELSRMAFTEFTLPDDREVDWGLYRELIAGKRDKYEIEKRYLKKGGGVVWGLLIVSLVKDRQGLPMYAVGMVQDITERKRAEEQLRLMQFSVDHASDAITWVDSQSRIVYANEAASRSLGYSREELHSLTIPDIDRHLPKEDWGAHWEKLRERGSMTFETQNVSKQGGVFPVEVSANYLEFDGKEYSFAFVRDITERKRAQDALRESDQRYKDFISHSHEGVWRIEMEQPIPIELPTEEILERTMQYSYMAECNLAFARNLGFSTLEEVVGRPLRDLIPSSDQERLSSIRSAIQGGLRSRTQEFRGLDKAGNCKYFLRTEIPIIENGMWVRAWGITRDITELKQAEEERLRSLEQLRALAGRLQSIREEERKRVAREIHDQLGQALTAIKIDFSSLIRELAAGEKQPSKRTASILQLVDESIHSVRRIATELRPGILDDLGLVAAIEWAGEDFESRTGTQCRLDLPPESIAVDAERATAIFRIFQETLTNVARHADASLVDVRLAKEDGDLTLEVHDNGKGISEDKLLNGKSLGILGMRERAMLLGGELTISGPPGSGTTVRVRIPKARRS